jgi:hypothetical protein
MVRSGKRSRSSHICGRAREIALLVAVLLIEATGAVTAGAATQDIATQDINAGSDPTGTVTAVQYRIPNDQRVGKDSAIAVSGKCLGADQTPGGRLVIICRNTQYSPTAWVVLFPPTGTARTLQEESDYRHAAVENELGLGKPTHDFPPEALQGTFGPSTTITHAAVYQSRLGVLGLETFTRLSPEGNAFFATYASFDAQKFAEGLNAAKEQFLDWHPAEPAALPAVRQNVGGVNEWGRAGDST